MLPAQPNLGLLDGIRCIERISLAREPIGARALSRELRLEPTRTHRLLKTLAHLGMVVQQPDRRYYLGPGAHVLSARGLERWRRGGNLDAVFGELQASVSHRVSLGVYWEGAISIIHDSEGGMDMAGSYGPSRLTGATESGLGLALLAEQPEGEVERVYWDRPIPGFAGGWTALRASLWEAKSQGFAYRRAERAGERPSLGMPLKDGMSGLGLSGAIGEKEVGDLLFQLRRAVELLARDQL